MWIKYVTIDLRTDLRRSTNSLQRSVGGGSTNIGWIYCTDTGNGNVLIGCHLAGLIGISAAAQISGEAQWHARHSLAPASQCLLCSVRCFGHVCPVQSVEAGATAARHHGRVLPSAPPANRVEPAPPHQSLAAVMASWACGASSGRLCTSAPSRPLFFALHTASSQYEPPIPPPVGETSSGRPSHLAASSPRSPPPFRSLVPYRFA